MLLAILVDLSPPTVQPSVRFISHPPYDIAACDFACFTDLKFLCRGKRKFVTVHAMKACEAMEVYHKDR